MRTQQKIVLLVISFLWLLKLEGQTDSTHIPKTFNQLGVGVLGDNHLTSVISLTYSRKMNAGFIVFGGIGLPRTISASGAQTSFRSYSFDAGFLVRKNYRRNGFWGSFSATVATGKWMYVTGTYTYFDSTGQRIVVRNYTYHDIEFELFPAACYQLQSRNEHFFCRFTGGVKLFPSLFLESYDDKVNDHNKFFPWIGINVGGAW